MITLEQVQATIDAEINPIIKLHNGFCQAVSLADGVLHVDLKGGCVGCPSSKITLYNGILPILQEKYPEILEIVLV